jgi:hypothetical protein
VRSIFGTLLALTVILNWLCGGGVFQASAGWWGVKIFRHIVTVSCPSSGYMVQWIPFLLGIYFLLTGECSFYRSKQLGKSNKSTIPKKLEN